MIGSVGLLNATRVDATEGSRTAVLIVMAGLPGTGKSTLAQRLAQELTAIVLDKDAVRAALFPASEIEYSTPQDDLVVDMMLQVARYLMQKNPPRVVILDGRTFSRRYQVATVRNFARRAGVKCVFVECVCSEETVRQRLQRDAAKGFHPAANRDYEMYTSVKALAEPIAGPKFVVDTEQDPGLAVVQCLDYIGGLDK
jgi:adenylylsulfate kinase